MKNAKNRMEKAAVKQIKAKELKQPTNIIDTKIEKNSTLSKQHVACILLYCHNDRMQKKFNIFLF